MTRFNGYKNWNHWNVSLWLNNDEDSYKLMKDYIRRARGNRDKAASMMADDLKQCCPTTPDGAPYSKSSIRAAMVGI